MWDNKVTENPTNPYETKEMEAEDMELTTTHGYNLYDISSMEASARRDTGMLVPPGAGDDGEEAEDTIIYMPEIEKGGE